MTYSHVVVDPQLSPAGQADFPILEDSPHFADFRDRQILCNWRIFLDLVDFLQEAPVGYLQPCLHHRSALAEVAGSFVSVVRLAMLLLVTLYLVRLFY